MKPTEEDRKFLATLNFDGSPTSSWHIPTATRAQDRARQRAKKYGWAVFDRTLWEWRLLEAGRQLLKEKHS